MARPHDDLKFVTGTAPVALTAASDYVSLRQYNHCTVWITIDNGDSVTATEVALTQAQAVAATGAKTLGFTTYYANTDTAAGDTETATTASSNTFNSSTTNAKNLSYRIEVDAAELDVANSFDCLCVTCANGANSVGQITFVLSEPRYKSTLAETAITD